MTVQPSLEVAKKLNAEGRSVGLLDMATVKPLDVDAVLVATAPSKAIITVEEHNIFGGLGSAVAEVLAKSPGSARLVRHG
jgi:transketolase